MRILHELKSRISCRETSYDGQMDPDMPDIINDIELMERISGGDHEAVSLLVDRYGAMVYRTALKILCDPELAKDVVQEVFIRIWRKASSFDSRYPLKIWIYRITGNRCIDCLRKERLLHPFAGKVPDGRLPEAFIPLEASPEKKLIMREEWKAFAEASSQLSPRQRQVYVLRELEGLASEDVARMTGLTPDQIKSNLHYARKKMREMLEKYFR